MDGVLLTNELFANLWSNLLVLAGGIAVIVGLTFGIMYLLLRAWWRSLVTKVNNKVAKFTEGA